MLQKYLKNSVLSGLFVVLLLIDVVAAALTLHYWQNYQNKFVSLQAQYSAGKLSAHSYALDSYDFLLSLRRLESCALQFSAGLLSKQDLDRQRRQVIGHFMNYREETPMGSALRSHASFMPAYTSAQVFLASVQRLEERQVSIAEVLQLSAQAVDAWSLFKADTNARDDASRDMLEQAMRQSTDQLDEGLQLLESLLGICFLISAFAFFISTRLRAAQAHKSKNIELIIACLSHDLKSPLQVIESAAALLRRELPSDERQKYAAVIRSATLTMAKLIDDIFKTARGDVLATEYRSVALKKWFAELTDFYQIKAQNKGLEFSCSYRSDMDHVEMDPDRLRQCVGNLIDNAIQYTDKGHVTVGLHAQRDAHLTDQGMLHFSVNDTGKGIPDAEKLKIFEPFVRGIASGNKRGMGLGLSIFKNLAQAFGARYWLQSELGSGTSFYFDCPVQVGVDLHEATPCLVTDTAEHAGQRVAHQPEVLVVDDDTDIFLTTAAVLTDAGYATDVAISGQQALGLLAKADYSVVITDINMPGMNGFELAQKIRAKPGKQPYLIAMSASRLDFQADSRCAVFDATLEKPVAVEKLLDAIEKFETLSATAN